MKLKHYFFALFLGLSLNALFARQIPNPNFSELENTICLGDSTQLVLLPQYWTIYQTQNDKWDGPIDSSICIGVTNISGFTRIPLRQINPIKPLFIRNQLSEDEKILLAPNVLYSFQSTFGFSPNVEFELADSCANGLCTGLTVGIEIPDATGSGTAMRVHHAQANIDQFNCDASACVPTENFAENYLKEVVLKFTFKPGNLANEWLELYWTAEEEVWDFIPIERLTIQDWHFNGTSYDLNLGEALDDYWLSVFLLKYIEPSYPSPDNPSFIEVAPPMDADQQASINLFIDEWQSFTPQPFAYIRGTLLENNDSTRHIVNLINNGGRFCLPWVEVIFANESRYVHRSGHINLTDSRACMMFYDGGALEVADNTTLHYGEEGIGLLALRQGGTIKLGYNSHLIIDNTLIMNERDTDLPAQIYMELNPGSRLSFGPSGHLSNKGSIDGTIKLNIYMNGGILDDHHLSTAEKALINKIYPTSSLPPNDLQVYPNPTDGMVHVQGQWLEGLSALYIEILSNEGRLIKTMDYAGNVYSQDLLVDLHFLPKGIYYLRLVSENGTLERKVLLME
ncbi:MAG: T9SS type A sorting domain-containing protein [Bacteroidota bacterium]